MFWPICHYEANRNNKWAAMSCDVVWSAVCADQSHNIVMSLSGNGNKTLLDGAYTLHSDVGTGLRPPVCTQP